MKRTCTTPEPQINALVNLQGETLWTSSNQIANAFKKRHTDVLRAIKNLECTAVFRERNFASAEYIDEQGKPRPNHQLTRDGFALLAMGFTGTNAAVWKERYINAFNVMEQELQRSRTRKGELALLQIEQQKSSMAVAMTNALTTTRKASGKVTLPRHFINEHKLCNWVLTESYTPLPDDQLEPDQIVLLTQIRFKNTLIIMDGLEYKVRKQVLRACFPLQRVFANA